MNKLQTIAKITLAALGLFLVIDIAKSFLTSLLQVIFTPQTGNALAINLILLAIVLVVAVVIAYQLIYKSGKWALKLTADAQDAAGQAEADWVLPTYRIMAVVAGILFLFWTLPSFIGFLIGLPAFLKAPEAKFYMLIPTLVGSLVKLAMGIYFFLGAPHFVKWQAKQTLSHFQNQAS